MGFCGRCGSQCGKQIEMSACTSSGSFFSLAANVSGKLNGGSDLQLFEGEFPNRSGTGVECAKGLVYVNVRVGVAMVQHPTND